MTLQLRLEPVQIIPGDRLNVSAQHGRVRSLVLAPHAGELMRSNDSGLRPSVLQRGLQSLLVARVGVRVQQADGDCLDPLSLEGVDDPRQLVERDRGQNLAMVTHPLSDLESQAARNKRLGFLIADVEKIRPVAASDLQNVPEAAGRNEPGLDSASLGDRVDDDGRPMGEEIGVGDLEPGLAQRIHHAFLKPRWCGVRLFGLHRAQLAGFGIHVVVDEVCERASDVARHSKPVVSALSGMVRVSFIHFQSPPTPRRVRTHSPKFMVKVTIADRGRAGSVKPPSTNSSLYFSSVRFSIEAMSETRSPLNPKCRSSVVYPF